jgi:tetratricopeptide (TPR) repeat protein
VSRESDLADQIMRTLLGESAAAVNRPPQELIEEGREARRRGQPELAHESFVAAALAAGEAQNTKYLGRAMVALADNALHFYPHENTDVFQVRQVLAERGKEILDSVRDDAGVAQALRVLSSMAAGLAGREMLEESLEISKRLGDTEGVQASLERLGSHLALYGDQEEAIQFKRQSLELARAIGDQERIAEGLFSLSVGFDGSQEEHRTLLEEAQVLYGILGRKVAEARCLMMCAQLACDESDVARRTEYLERAAQLGREAGDISMYRNCLDILIDLFRQQGNMSKAHSLEEERKPLPKDEFPEELVKELEEAFSVSDPETMVSAVRKWFSGGDRSG